MNKYINLIIPRGGKSLIARVQLDSKIAVLSHLDGLCHTYIDKDASINDEIDKMRHAATRALFERRDVIIVASVSCIYGIGSLETYSEMTLTIEAFQPSVFELRNYGDTLWQKKAPSKKTRNVKD